MKDNYSKAYKEVIEILKYVPEESVKKIPQSVLDTFKINMDEEHDFTVDINKSFEDQNLLVETKAIFANIFRDYWATPYQKERIEAKEKYDLKQEENQKQEKYNPNDLFKKADVQNNNMNNLPVTVEQENFYQKIIRWLKKIFNLG